MILEVVHESDTWAWHLGVCAHFLNKKFTLF